MGKASKWFRGLLALKKPDSSSPSPTSSAPTPPKDRRRWTFVKSYRQNDHLHVTTVKPGVQDPDNHAIAVAEVAVPAAAVPRGTCAGVEAEGTGNRKEWAAVKIQAAFRGCLARRALRALKGLVKLQALVRGYIERKRTAEWLQRMLVLLRAQARVRAGRDQILLNSSSSVKSSNVHIHGPATPHKFENPIRSKSMKYDQSSILKRNGSKSYVQINGNQEKCWNTAGNWVDEQPWNRQRSSIRSCSMDDERNARIQEIDSMKPYLTPKHTNLFHSNNHALVSDHDSQSLITTKDSTTHQSGPSHSCKVQQSYSILKVHEAEESPFCAADGSPQFFSASSREGGSKRSPFTPTRSDGSRSYLSGYSDYPNYMACTESSMAKVRSLSAPKQRPQYERSSSSNRYSINGFSASRLTARRVSALHASFTSKAYPGSGRLDKLDMPAGYRY